MSETQLLISEMFGPTIQGEGRSQGQPALFLRMGLCNLDCKWCDTPYTWDWTGKNGKVYDKTTELRHVTIEEVAEWCVSKRDKHNTELLVISGGEPMIQQRRLLPLVESLTDLGFRVEFETNGTLHPDLSLLARARFNVSPKLASSGVDPSKAIDYKLLRVLSGYDSSFKFVVADDEDLAAMVAVINQVEIEPSRVYVMPEGRTREEIIDRLPRLFEMCADRGWNLSPRLHVLAFNDKRGI